MDEQKKNEGTKEEKPVEVSEDGDKPKSTQLIGDANLAAKRMEDATKALKEQNDRQEELQIQAKLGGRAEAGIPPTPPETDDEKWAREAKVRYEGTGMDPTDDEK